MHSSRTAVLFVVALVLVAVGYPLRGQAVANGQISGVVTDPQGGLLPGAVVSVTQTGTGIKRETITGNSGEYTLSNLPVGTYDLQVSAAGFSKQLAQGIELHVGNSITRNVQLRIGTTTEQIVVSAGGVSIETEQTSVSQVVDHQRIVDLPLNGRQATQFILLSGAATTTPPGDLTSNKNYPSSTTMSIAGGQGNGTNYLMDGGDNNDPWSSVNLPFPFPDALDEFNVQYNSLPAKYGVHPGGVVNVVTKSGSNKFHGDFFEFVRNGDFNARNYFARSRDTLHRNQFGGTIGGPVIHDKLFFFAGYQKTIQRTTPPTTISYVPTQAVLNGDFTTFESTSAGCVATNKTLKGPFVANKVNPALYNQQALNLLKSIPVSSDPCGQTVYGIPNPSSEDQYIGRLDWNLTSKHTIFGRYYYTKYVAPAPTLNASNLLPSTLGGVDDTSTSGIFGDTYTFTTNLVNNFHFTYTSTEIGRQTAVNLTDPGKLGVNIYTAVPNFLNLTVSGRFSIGCGSCAPANFNRNSQQIADDIDYIRGKHHIAFGGDWIHTALDQRNVLNADGAFTFDGSFTGDALADFLLGDIKTFTQGNISLGDYRQDYVGAYVQDTYKASQHITATLGVRWEPFMPAADTYGRGSYFDASAFASGSRSTVYVNAPPGLRFVGDAGVPKGYVHKRFGDFEPRVGIVWDPAGNGRGVVRAGYGMFYDFPEIAFSTGFNSNAPWGNTISLTSPSGGFANPYAGVSGGNPFPLPVPPASTQPFPQQEASVSLPPGFRPTYVQQFDLSVEHQVGKNWSLSATYLGNVTRHTWGGISLNPAVYIPGTCGSSPCSTTSNTASRRRLTLQNSTYGPYYSSITGGYDGGSGSFNGVILSAKRQFANHYSVIANYTYSHCLSTVDFTGDIGATSPTVMNPNDPSADYGNCNFDLRHNLNVSAVLATPDFTERALRYLVTGWELAPILSRHTGFFFSPLTGTDASLTGVNLDRPNVVHNPYLRNTSTLRWLDSTAFTANAPGTFGNARRNSLEGPSYVDLDMALIRNFRVHEYGTFQFRAEAFNLLNHTNFINPSATLSNANTFGKLQSAYDPRILQLAAKFTF